MPPTDARRARVDRVDWDDETAEKGGYETFMLKEIHEQAEAVAETVLDRTAARRRRRPRRAWGRSTTSSCAGVRRIIVVACGTSLPRRA
jgi:glucosamine--fructose-6-phosphate aminotransferase (isomerizing)